MASLQELRKRLRSIQTTGQLAGAMRTAATAKYARLGKVREGYAPYAEACRGMRAQLGGAGLPRPADSRERDCLVVMSGNRGMCGGFNAELMRCLSRELAGRDDPIVLVCGKKAAAHLREWGTAFEEHNLSDVPAYDETRALTDRILALYASGEAARVFVVYQSFQNMLTQTPAVRQLLPETDAADADEADDTLLYLPDRETIARRLAETCLAAQVYETALENAVGAQAATVMAMRSACDNASAAAAELDILINRRRQAEITSGVIETASGMNQQGE